MNYKTLTDAEKKIFRMAAIFSFIPAFIYVKGIMDGIDLYQDFRPEPWYLVFALLYVGGTEIFARALHKTTINFESILFGILFLTQSLSLCLFGYQLEDFGVMQWFMWHGTAIYYVLTRAQILAAGRTGILFPLDMLQGGMALPWPNFLLRFKSLYSRISGGKQTNTTDILIESSEQITLQANVNEATTDDEIHLSQKGKNIFILIVSILIAVIVCMIAIGQLVEVSNSFASIGDRFVKAWHSFWDAIFSAKFIEIFFEEFFWYFIWSLPVGAWLFGLVGGSLIRGGKAPADYERVDHEFRACHVLPEFSAYIIVGSLIAIYVLFFAVSVNELVSVFDIAGQRAAIGEGVDGSSLITAPYACRMAVKGFWELVRIIVLNFAVLAGFTVFAKQPLWEKKNTKILATILFACAIAFAFLAGWKLFVIYIGLFGLTPRRALSGWMLAVLTLWCVLVVIRFYKKIQAVRIGVLAAAISFTALVICDITYFCV